MLRGRKAGLRARHEEDVPILHAELHSDVEYGSRTETGPWLPRPLPPEGSSSTVDELNVRFSIVEPESGTLLGGATLWGVDTHNRLAHIGLGLRPAHRGKGYGTDVVAVLCHYGFVVRGLHRLQIETLADNTAMLRSAERNGFVREGLLRSSAWVMGEFLDEVVLGLLARDWKPGPGVVPGGNGEAG